MHQASILFTALVMMMAGAWYVMQDMSAREGAPASAAAAAHSEALVD